MHRIVLAILSTTSSTYISMSRWVFNNVNPLSRFSRIIFLRYVFKRLRVKNDLSPVTVVTGNKAKIIKSLR